MFRWYKAADVCFVYLSDAEYSDDGDEQRLHIAGSKWFTRGWTLQELIAPAEVVFYSRDWRRLGSKSGALMYTLSDITGIKMEYLRGEDIESASVAQRMHWASRRKTSRVEDMAYCLLGIFDVNMPLIYGEGKKAFKRLQEEIMKRKPADHTLFAWGVIVDGFSWALDEPKRNVKTKRPQRKPFQADRPLRGLLADSPRDFEYSSGMVAASEAEFYYQDPYFSANPPTTFGSGIRIDMPVMPGDFRSYVYYQTPHMTLVRKTTYATLFCEFVESPLAAVLIPLVESGNREWGRTRELIVSDQMVPPFSNLEYKEGNRTLFIAPQPRWEVKAGDLVLRQPWKEGNEMVQVAAGYNFIQADGRATVKSFQNEAKIILLMELTDHHGFGVMIGRAGAPWRPGDALHVGLFAIQESFEQASAGHIKIMRDCGLQWHDLKNLNGLFDQEPIYNRKMTAPHDTWELDIAPFPLIKVKTERLFLDGYSGQPVDIIDVEVQRGTAKDLFREDPRKSRTGSLKKAFSTRLKGVFRQK